MASKIHSAIVFPFHARPDLPAHGLLSLDFGDDVALWLHSERQFCERLSNFGKPGIFARNQPDKAAQLGKRWRKIRLVAHAGYSQVVWPGGRFKARAIVGFALFHLND
jgi:hypothetical protein